MKDPETIDSGRLSVLLMSTLTELAGVVKCWCERCDKEQASPNEISLFLRFRMNLCPICGDKRCPRAADHRNECATELAKSSETVAGEVDRMTGVKADVIRTFGDSRLRVYISGPMTGYPNLNRPAFAMAAEKVEAAGMIPVNPHDLCEPNWDWHQCMRADVSALCGCDAILMIDGWHCSNGAQLELHIAHRIGLRVLLNWHDVIDFAGRK